MEMNVMLTPIVDLFGDGQADPNDIRSGATRVGAGGTVGRMAA